MARIPLAGSERAARAGATDLGAADPDARFAVSVLIRRRSGPELGARVTRLRDGDPSDAPMTREAFADAFGADPADAAAVERFAGEFGLDVVSRDLPRRTIRLSGTVAQFNAAFAVSLRRFDHPSGAYRGRVGSISLPDDLADVVEAVLGLDDRPQASPHFRVRTPNPSGAPQTAPTSFTPREIAALYGFPAGDGAGECIAIIELGGGYTPADLATYFAAMGISAPTVVAVSVDEGANSPTGTANGPDGEVMLDIEVAGSVAPGARLAVYFAPNTDAGFIDAVTTAAHDTANRPSVISISWGGPESTWTAQARTAMDAAFQAAAAMGVTVTVASGDNGASDGVAGGADHVDFPASSPHALACGGTSLRASGGVITSESVWNDGAGGGAGGGGISADFPRPAWQAGLSAVTMTGHAKPLTRRGVPDVSGDADPETGYQVRVDGADTVFGGTSAVAPLWAGLIALINAQRGSPVGYLNPLLYAHPQALNDITQGNNGGFDAAKGWDACTGLGSPKGAAIAAALAK
jgi:kumamolisin